MYYANIVNLQKKSKSLINYLKFVQINSQNTVNKTKKAAYLQAAINQQFWSHKNKNLKQVLK